MVSTLIKESRSHKLHTSEVLRLLEEAHQKLEKRRRHVLSNREVRQRVLQGRNLDRDPAMANVRDSNWQLDIDHGSGRSHQACLIGSAGREDLINGLNSGASTYIADLWNMMPQNPKALYRGHRNLHRAMNRELVLLNESDGKSRVSPESFTGLCVVPRPMAVMEESVSVNGEEVCASIYDIIIHAVLNHERLIQQQNAIYFGLRGVCCHIEAGWYRSLFELIEEHLDIPRGTIRVMPIIDNISAAIEIDEVLFELRSHCFAVTADPQSFAQHHIRLYSDREGPVMPDREAVGLDAPFLRSLLVHVLGTAHRRNALAIFPPGFHLHPSELVLKYPGYEEMIEDIRQGVKLGFDGAIVASPLALRDMHELMDELMPDGHQLAVQCTNCINLRDLIQYPEGQLTTNSLILMVRTALRYRMAERLNRPWAIQGGRKHDRSSMGLAIGILSQWNHSSQGFISNSGLQVDEQLIRYLIDKETHKMFSDQPESVQQEAQLEKEKVIELVTTAPNESSYLI